ncbi:MAG: response regulator [Candidatus Accumulibacter phosphatis]|nr:response regulator [Candidatus Accumulibacter phosphatis]
MNTEQAQSVSEHGAETAKPYVEHILCVDDESNILSALRRLFRQRGYHISIATSGAAGLQILADGQAFDLVISDMRMPEMDGAEFLEQVSRRYPDTVRILLTGYADISSTINAINRGQIFRYISKPWNDEELLLTVKQALDLRALQREKRRLEELTARQNADLKSLNHSLEEKVKVRTQELASANDKLRNSFLTAVKVFANLIELRGSNLAGHSRRVADLAHKMANKLGMSGREAQDVFLAGLLHDVGKIGLPDYLLAKAVAQMSGDDLDAYRTHPVKGERSLMALDELRGAASCIRAHHERFDGQGFPDGLSRTDIPLGARILAVANDFDGFQIGIVAPRRLSPEETKKTIFSYRGRRYDPEVVDVFLAVAGRIEPEHRSVVMTTVDNLKPGSVLARDLVTREGVLLLAADYVLDANLVRQIQAYAATEEGTLMVHVRNDRS